MSLASRLTKWSGLFPSGSDIRTPSAPDSVAVSQLLGKIDAMLAQLNRRAAHADRVSQIASSLTNLKTPPAGQPGADLPMKNGIVDGAEWERRPSSERQKVGSILASIHDELRYLNRDVLACGQRQFLVIAILLIVAILTYLCAHHTNVRTLVYAQITPPQSVAIAKDAHLIEIELTALKAIPNTLPTAPSSPAPPQQSQPPGKTPPSPEAPPRPDTTLKPPPLKEHFQTLTMTLTSLPLSHETLRLLGAAVAELEAKDSAVHLTYLQFLKHLQADLESLSTAYFWTISPWRWAEIVWWATMGCLVGLLFYIAGLLKQGVFYPEEIPMFGAELLMAPIVVPVVFFLFGLSGITELTPNQSPITTTIGVAFIFGFAIRRSIGVLDLIKKRFFPDPSP